FFFPITTMSGASKNPTASAQKDLSVKSVNSTSFRKLSAKCWFRKTSDYSFDYPFLSMLKSRVLIIGQGLAGTVLCHELEQRGIQAVVVDNSHHRSASKVAAGLFNPFVFKWTTKSWNIDAVLPVMQQTYTQLEDLLG